MFIKNLLFQGKKTRIYSNIHEVNLCIAEDTKDNTPIGAKKMAIKYCDGFTDVVLKHKRANNYMCFEGHSAFAYHFEEKDKFTNIQIFFLFNYGSPKLIDDMIVLRVSKWLRKEELFNKENNIDIPILEEETVLLEKDNAIKILEKCNNVIESVQKGYFYSEREKEIFGEKVLRIVDSHGTYHELRWNGKTHIDPIEEKLEEVLDTIELNHDTSANYCDSVLELI